MAGKYAYSRRVGDPSYINRTAHRSRYRNLIDGVIFFWVDQFIFISQSLAAQGEVKKNITCIDCGRVARGWRLVRSGDYDRTQDHELEFRYEDCSRKKTEKFRERGVKN
jgi:hypothetical protein